MASKATLRILEHSAVCTDHYCHFSECRQMQTLLTHGVQCKQMSCVVCQDVNAMILAHTGQCYLNDCPVANCDEIRNIMRAERRKEQEQAPPLINELKALQDLKIYRLDKEKSTEPKKRKIYKCGKCGHPKIRPHKCQIDLRSIPSRLPLNRSTSFNERPPLYQHSQNNPFSFGDNVFEKNQGQFPVQSLILPYSLQSMPSNLSYTFPCSTGIENLSLPLKDSGDCDSVQDIRDSHRLNKKRSKIFMSSNLSKFDALRKSSDYAFSDIQNSRSSFASSYESDSSGPDSPLTPAQDWRGFDKNSNFSVSGDLSDDMTSIGNSSEFEDDLAILFNDLCTPKHNRTVPVKEFESSRPVLFDQIHENKGHCEPPLQDFHWTPRDIEDHYKVEHQKIIRLAEVPILSMPPVFTNTNSEDFKAPYILPQESAAFDPDAVTVSIISNRCNTDRYGCTQKRYEDNLQRSTDDNLKSLDKRISKNGKVGKEKKKNSIVTDIKLGGNREISSFDNQDNAQEMHLISDDHLPTARFCFTLTNEDSVFDTFTSDDPELYF